MRAPSRSRVLGVLASVAFFLSAAALFGQAIVGTVAGSNQAVVFPSPNIGLPTPTENPVPGLPSGVQPQGVAYFGSDNALVSDFGNSRVFVIKISTASLVSTINSTPYNGTGPIAVAPGLTAALASGGTNSVQVISAPFQAGSTITSVPLPGSIAGYQTEAIVFNAAGRAFIWHTTGVSVLDPPYSSVAFTIPVAGNSLSGAIAITPDGNTLLVTNLAGNTVGIISAPFSATSTVTPLTIPGGIQLDGIFASPDGTKVLVCDAGGSNNVFAISPPYSSSSTVEKIPLGATSFGSFEDVGISADGQLAIVVGNGGGNPNTPFIRAPFTAAGATVFNVTIQGGRGNGAVRFLPPGLAPGLTITKSAPASVAAGSNLTYTITYGNTGGANASNVVIKDPVPAGTTFVSATGGGTLSGGVVTWNIGTVNAGVTGQTVSFTVNVTATLGKIDNVNYTIEGTGIAPIPGPPVSTSIGGGCPTITLSPSTLPDATQGTAYNQTITAVGGTGPYTFAVTAGALPAGLTLSTGGVLSGTPTAAGTFNFTIQATDANACTGTAAYSLVVTPSGCLAPPPPGLSIAPTDLSRGQTVTLSWNETVTPGQGFYIVQVSVNGAGFAPIGTVQPSGTSTASFVYGGTGTPGTYDFRVLAVPACNPAISAASNVVRATVAGPCSLNPVVTGLTIDVTSALPGGSFTLTWNPAVGFSGNYAVFKSTDGGGNFQRIGTTAATSFTGTVSDPPGTTLTFEVEADAGCVFGQKSNFVTLTVTAPPPPVCNPPGPVTNVQIRAFAVDPARAPSPTEYVLVTWTAPVGGTAPTRYGVRINGDPEVLVVGTSVVLPPRGKSDPITAFVTAYACAALVSAEIYDPATGAWSVTGNLALPRQAHTATALGNGRVLVAGGVASLFGAPTPTAEVFDPPTGAWNATGALAAPRELHAATSLGSSVLVEGGFGTQPLASAELYDSTTGAWTPVGSLATARDLHTATLLPNGKVLVAGGLGAGPLSSAELYDPTTRSWTATGSLATARYRHSATLLPNGKVLVLGGLGAGGALASAELYDPTAGTWISAGRVGIPREAHTATLLGNGRVLVAGGDDGATPLASAELFDPSAGTSTPTGNLGAARRAHTATALSNGRVLMAGGFGAALDKALKSAELYDPASGVFAGTGPLNGSHGTHTATLLGDGRVLVAGAADSLGTEKASTTTSSAAVALFLAPPVASFTVSASPRAGSAVTFTDTSSPQATSWLWIFDDGTTDTRQNPTHTFANAGTHQVTLIASNGAGSSSVTQSFAVAAAAVTSRAAPSAAFSLDQSDPARQRARVSLAGRDAFFLHLRSSAADETTVFVRFLDPAGVPVVERRIAVEPGEEAAVDLGAYGLSGEWTIELVGAEEMEAWIVEVGRPGPREIRR